MGDCVICRLCKYPVLSRFYHHKMPALYVYIKCSRFMIGFMPLDTAKIRNKIIRG